MYWALGSNKFIQQGWKVNVYETDKERLLEFVKMAIGYDFHLENPGSWL